MTLNDLVQRTTWNEIKDQLLTHFHWHFEKIAKKRFRKKKLKKFEKAYQCLGELTPERSEWQLTVELTETEEGRFADVSGINGTLYCQLEDFDSVAHEEFAQEPVRFGLEGENWSVWLGMEILQADLKKMSASEYLVHCLWEMTFLALDRN